MPFKAGSWVGVRSKAEILRSLDRNGRLEKLPFMPEMFEYCGQRFRVYKRAHKTCDTVNPSAGRSTPPMQCILNFVAMAKPTAGVRRRA